MSDDERMRDALLKLYYEGVGWLVSFNITDKERVRRANLVLRAIEDALR